MTVKNYSPEAVRRRVQNLLEQGQPDAKPDTIAPATFGETVTHLRAHLEARGLDGDALENAIYEASRGDWVTLERDGKLELYRQSEAGLSPVDSVARDALAVAIHNGAEVDLSQLPDDELHLISNRTQDLKQREERAVEAARAAAPPPAPRELELPPPPPPAPLHEWDDADLLAAAARVQAEADKKARAAHRANASPFASPATKPAPTRDTRPLHELSGDDLIRAANRRRG